jgi:hypothetical protein
MIKQIIVGGSIILVILIMAPMALAVSNHQRTPKSDTTPAVVSEPTTNTSPSTQPTTPDTTTQQQPTQLQGQAQGQTVTTGKGGTTATQLQGQGQAQTGVTGTQAQIQAQSQSITILNKIIRESGGTTVIRQGSGSTQIIILPVYVPGTGFVAPFNCKNIDSVHITCEFQVVASK